MYFLAWPCQKFKKVFTMGSLVLRISQTDLKDKILNIHVGKVRK